MERRSSREDLVGRQIGRYAVVSHLASGGMSELYIARQEAVGGFEKNLVIKVLQDRYAQHARVVRMFLDEARLAAKLNHPSIVHVYDVAEEDGNKLIAMEYIHGETLTDIIKRGVEVGTFLPLEHALFIISQVAAGLDYAHRRNEPTGGLLRIVHRDVSPSNIMVSYEGQSKVIDFGIARVQDQIREESGMQPGKPSYMSPEQVAGAELDYRSDIFSLGIILFEITLAQRLWRGPSEEVKKRILTESIPPPTSIRRDYPPALELIVMRALEKRPEDRYQSAEEMRQDLEELVTSAGFRSGARRMSVYMGELFPLRAQQPEDGIVEARSSESGDSAPLPVVGGVAPVGESRRTTIVASPMAPMSPRATGSGPGSTPTPLAALPISPAAPSQLGGAGVGHGGALSRAPEAMLPAQAPTPRGPSNTKLAFGAAIVTFALVTAIVFLGRSRREGPATAVAPAGSVSGGPQAGPIARVEPPPPPPVRAPERLPSVAETSTLPPPPAPSSGPPYVAPLPPPSRGPTASSDRARYRRQRRQVSSVESSNRSSGAAPESQAPTPPASSATPEVQRSTPPAESANARPALRPVARTAVVAALPPVRRPDPAAAPAATPPGFVDPKAVTAVVRTHAAEVQACFDRALMERGDLRGRLTVRATVDPGGHVLTASPTAVMEGGGRLQTCVVAAFQRWTFPAPTGGVKGTIAYSFSFE